MGDDDIYGFFAITGLLILVLCIPLLVWLSIAGCMAYYRTGRWKKEKARREADQNTNGEMDALANEEEDSNLDSEDEAELAAQQKENGPDWDLTPRQKFKKEFRKVFKGKDLALEAKKKEREERARVAKAVAKELTRIERRRERREQLASSSRGQTASDDNEDSLPSYKNVVGGHTKD